MTNPTPAALAREIEALVAKATKVALYRCDCDGFSVGHERDCNREIVGYRQVLPDDAVSRLTELLPTILSALKATDNAAVEERGEPVAWPEQWYGDITVGNMIANLRTLPPEMPIYSAYHIIREDRPALLRIKRPTVSRERVDGLTIKTGDESIPYSAVIWSHPREPERASHPAPTSAQVDALVEAKKDDNPLGIGIPYSPGCWHWYSDQWSDVIEHDGSAAMPENLDPNEPVLIAYNPQDHQTAETWGSALRRATPAGERDWECVTAYRRAAVS